jgi:multiple sugar transport system permease protein/raffinose/stachyose/melibiose transport system permease protein
MFPYFVLAPILFLLLLFIVLPIIGSFVIAFFDYNPLRQDGGNYFIGFSNFRSLFTDELFIKSLTNTLYYVFTMVGINLVMTLIIAQALCTLRSNKWRSLFRVAFFLPCVAPLSAVSFVWIRSIFPTRGALNMLLSLFGIPAVNWLGSAATLMPSILILSLWADVGYNIILFIAGIQGIPDDFFEAATIDGAGPVRSFLSVTLPLLGRTLAFVIAMTFISQFQAFAQFSIVAGSGGPGRAGYVLSTYIYDIGFKSKDMGYASAISVALFLLILIVTAVQQRLNRVDWGY